MKFVCFVLGVAVGLIGYAYVFNRYIVVDMRNDLKSHKQMVIDCEKNIPRSIRCILTAVPEKKYDTSSFEHTVKETK